MIFYRKSYLGLNVLWQCTGSALPRAILPGLISALVAAAMELAISDDLLEKLIVHPYPFQVYCYITAFALVFRTNTAYARYWCACRCAARPCRPQLRPPAPCLHRPQPS
jgi:predicted membrane chloride channel (bestrophin family)